MVRCWPQNLRGLLCIGCLERRLGRLLTPEDFNLEIPLNQFQRMQSLRLRRRIHGFLDRYYSRIEERTFCLRSSKENHMNCPHCNNESIQFISGIRLHGFNFQRALCLSCDRLSFQLFSSAAYQKRIFGIKGLMKFPPSYPWKKGQVFQAEASFVLLLRGDSEVKMQCRLGDLLTYEGCFLKNQRIHRIFDLMGTQCYQADYRVESYLSIVGAPHMIHS